MNINDLKFEPKCPPEAFEAAKNWLVENRKNFTNMCNFVKVRTQPSLLIDGALDKPCHAMMQYDGETYATPKNPNWDCIATEIGVYRQCRDWPDLVDEDTYRPYVKWLTQDSYFSRFILNRDDFDFIMSYGIILSSDINSALLQNILISARYVVECSPHAFKLFNELIGKGHPGLAAYTYAFHSSVSTWDYNGRTPGLETALPAPVDDDFKVYSHPYHRAFHLWRSSEDMTNFLKGDYGPKLSDDPLTYYRNKPTIYGGSTFCLTGRARTKSLVEEFLKTGTLKEKLKKSRGEGSILDIIPNPFKRKPFGAVEITPDVVTRKELVDIVFPHLEEEGLFANACC